MSVATRVPIAIVSSVAASVPFTATGASFTGVTAMLAVATFEFSPPAVTWNAPGSKASTVRHTPSHATDSPSTSASSGAVIQSTLPEPRGLTERTVIMRHAFRNALLPLASIVPIDIITLLGGAIITETVFGWFGMGRLFVDSLQNNQQDPVMAYIVIVGVLAVVANFVSDLIYAVLDPRIRVAA